MPPLGEKGRRNQRFTYDPYLLTFHPSGQEQLALRASALLLLPFLARPIAATAQTKAPPSWAQDGQRVRCSSTDEPLARPRDLTRFGTLAPGGERTVAPMTHHAEKLEDQKQPDGNGDDHRDQQPIFVHMSLQHTGGFPPIREALLQPIATPAYPFLPQRPADLRSNGAGRKPVQDTLNQSRLVSHLRPRVAASRTGREDQQGCLKEHSHFGFKPSRYIQAELIAPCGRS